jgi:hypothetical protein
MNKSWADYSEDEEETKAEVDYLTTDGFEIISRRKQRKKPTKVSADTVKFTVFSDVHTWETLRFEAIVEGQSEILLTGQKRNFRWFHGVSMEKDIIYEYDIKNGKVNCQTISPIPKDYTLKYEIAMKTC